MLLIFLIGQFLMVPKCHSVDLDITELKNYLTPDTYESLNMSKAYKKFDLSEFDALNNMTRRWDMSRYSSSYRHWWTKELWHRNCFLSAQTYQGAYDEIRQYFQIRFLYVNNVQYEIGYLVHEIVHKYQMMLELYQIIVRRYFYAQERHFAPIPYMLYMYTNILEYSMHVIHLCNMLHEIEGKYVFKEKKSVFDNVYERSTRGRDRNSTHKGSLQDAIDDLAAKRQANKKKRAKELKKERNDALIAGNWKLTSVNRRPKKSFWPLEYGWSIEYW